MRPPVVILDLENEADTKNTTMVKFDRLEDKIQASCVMTVFWWALKTKNSSRTTNMKQKYMMRENLSTK